MDTSPPMTASNGSTLKLGDGGRVHDAQGPGSEVAHRDVQQPPGPDLVRLMEVAKPLVDAYFTGQRELAKMTTEVDRLAINQENGFKRGLLRVGALAILGIFVFVSFLVTRGYALESINLLTVLLGYAAAFLGGYGAAKVEIKLTRPAEE